jgi:signal transduction histidine kinase
LVLVAFVVVATLGVGGVEYIRGRRALVQRVTAELAASDRLVADRLERGLEQRRRLVVAWAELEAAQDLAVDDVDKRLASSLVGLADSFGAGEVAVGLGATDTVLAASNVEWIATAAEDRPWAAGGASDTGVSVRLTQDPELGTVVAATAAVWSRADGRRLGRIVLLTPWDALLRQAAGEHMGALEVEPGRTPGGDGDRLRSPPLPVPLGNDTVRLALSAPLAEALRPLDATRRQFALLALVVLAVTVPAGLFIARSNTAALRRLTETARRMDAAAVDAADFRAPDSAPGEVRVLAGALASMVRRLEAARIELAHQESLAAMGTMAAVLAHEIRTPLSVLRGSADMLRKRVADDERTGELVSFVDEEIQRLERLVNDLLAFARPRPPDMGATDLAAAAARAAKALGARAAEEGTVVEASLEPAPVRGDEEQLYQVTLNLLTNALEAAPGGTIELRTSADDVARLEVSDDGAGIPADRLEEVWTPFVTTRRGGTGLGLPLVRRIARAHGGDAAIESVPGAGTRVRVTLPLAEGGTE